MSKIMKKIIHNARRIIFRIEGKIEVLFYDMQLAVPEIAEKLKISQGEVQRVLDRLASK